MEALIVLILLLMTVHVNVTILIYNFLWARSIDTNFLLLRLFAIPNALAYKKITKEEAGKTRFLYYLWITTVNVALVLFIIYVLF
jgi:hypothetical protein